MRIYLSLLHTRACRVNTVGVQRILPRDAFAEHCYVVMLLRTVSASSFRLSLLPSVMCILPLMVAFLTRVWN